MRDRHHIYSVEVLQERYALRVVAEIYMPVDSHDRCLQPIGDQVTLAGQHLQIIGVEACCLFPHPIE